MYTHTCCLYGYTSSCMSFSNRTYNVTTMHQSFCSLTLSNCPVKFTSHPFDLESFMLHALVKKKSVGKYFDFQTSWFTCHSKQSVVLNLTRLKTQMMRDPVLFWMHHITMQFTTFIPQYMAICACAHMIYRRASKAANRWKQWRTKPMPTVSLEPVPSKQKSQNRWIDQEDLCRCVKAKQATCGKQ